MFIREMIFGAPDKSKREVPLTMATDAPVDMGDCYEVLDMTDVDLSRVPLPLIVSHNQKNLPIGVVLNVSARGGRLSGIARFGVSPEADQVYNDVIGGTITNVSIGYERRSSIVIDKVKNIIRTKFTPLECSVVSVPADPGAGFFRSYKVENSENLTRSQRAAIREAEENNLQIATRAERHERSRIQEIRAMGEAYGLSNLANQMIDDGTSIDEARNTILERKMNSHKNYQSVNGNEANTFIGMSDKESREFSISRMIRAFVTNDFSDAGLEREASRTIAKQLGRDTQGFFIPMDAMATRSTYEVGTAGQGTTGGTLVATNLLAGAFIDVLRKKTRVIEMGATVMSGLVGNIDIPRQTSATATAWVSESGNLTEAEGTFDKVSLSPKAIGTYSMVSRNMLMQSTPHVEAVIRSDLAAQLALGIDRAALMGSGSNNEPVGIFNQTGVLSVVGGTNGAAITFDHLIDMFTKVALNNADFGSLGYIVNAATLGTLSKLKTTTGQYLWPTRGGSDETYAPASANMGANGSGRAGDFSVNGYPLAVTNQLPSDGTKGSGTGLSSLVFGNWSDLMIGQWGVLEILPNPYDSIAYKQGAILLRAMQSVDIGVRHPQSFCVMSDAITS